MKTLQEWYRYLEEQTRKAAVASPAPAAPAGAPVSSEAMSETAPANGAVPSAERRAARATRQGRLAIDAPPLPPAPRRGGRRPMTESREEIIRRLLDPELSLHEAAAVLNLSKATLRRYTDQGRLACVRTAGGQRRFRLSDLLAFLEREERTP